MLALMKPFSLLKDEALSVVSSEQKIEDLGFQGKT